MTQPTVDFSAMALGRRAPIPGKVAVRFADIRTGLVPAHPSVVTRSGLVRDWDIRGNDRYGDCGPVSVANDRALTSLVLGGVEMYPTLTDTLDLYRRSGNPGFPSQDEGVVLQTMLEEVNKVGIAYQGKLVKCVAFAKVNVNDLEEVRAAISIFGGLILGVDLKVAQQSQRIWDYAPRSAEWGGHAVYATDYNSLDSTGVGDIGLLSWGQVLQLTDDFWRYQVEEAWVAIWPEHFGSVAFQQGVDVRMLATIYRDFTGQPLPLPVVPPTPSPTPMPTPADEDAVWAFLRKLWHELGDLLKRHGR